jgi:hypothetical protein
MSKKLDIAMPPDLDLGGNWTIRVTAVDPTTGAANTDVNIGVTTMVVEQLTPGSLESSGFKVVNPVLLRKAGG